MTFAVTDEATPPLGGRATASTAAPWHGWVVSAAFHVVVATFVAAEFWIGAGVASASLCLFALLVAVVQTQAGWLALGAGNLGDLRARLPAAFCVGFPCLTLPMFGLISLFRISALAAFILCASAVFLLSLRNGSRWFRPGPSDVPDVLVVSILAIAISVLTRVPVASVLALGTTGALPIWNDFFLHGVTISSFGSPFAIDSDMELAGIGRVFYHYAPFLLPAAFQPVSGQTGLVLSTSFLLPYGVLVAASGCYVFAVQLGGRRAALLAVVAVATVPVYRFPLQSGWLDFHWMLLTAPGVGYAIGISMIVCTVTPFYVDRGGARTLWFIGLLLLSIILVRVHFFMLMAPAVVLLIGLRHHWTHGRPAVLLLVGAGSLLAICVWRIPEIGPWFLAHCDPVPYLDFALKYTRWNGQPIDVAGHSTAASLAIKSLIVMTALLGTYVLVYPVLLGAIVVRFGLQRRDLIAPLVTLTFLALMLLAPSGGNGDFTEYKHRHFPLLYVMVAVCAVVYAVRLLPGRVVSSRVRDSLLACLIVAMLTSAAVLGEGSNPAAPDVRSMPWGADFHGQPVSAGLQDAARYIRSHAHRGDVMAMDDEAAAGQSRMIVDLVAMTDIPAFLARSELRLLRSECVRRTVEMRVDALKKIVQATDWAEARMLLQENGIRWYVVRSGSAQHWDPGRQRAVQSSGDVSVYDAGPQARDARVPIAECS